MITPLGSMVKPQKFKCGGWTGCEEDHVFFKPEDLLVLSEVMDYDSFRGCEEWSLAKEDKAREHQTLYFGSRGVAPTLLGMWYEDCAAN